MRDAGQRSLRIRPTVLADSFQPARASVRAIRSFPPKPASSIVLITALTTSAKRRTGGSVETRGRAASRSAPVASHLPPCDRLGRHSEHRRRLALRQAEETPDAQDPKALLWCVMRTMAFGHLVSARPEDPGRLARHPEKQGLLLGLFKHPRQRYTRVAQPAEGRPESEAEKSA